MRMLSSYYPFSKVLFRSAFLVLLWLCCYGAQAQESVFTGMQSNWKKAEKNFKQRRYIDALKFYQAAQGQKRTPPEIHLKMALVYVYLNQHQQVVTSLSTYYQEKGALPDSLYYQWAESESILGHYETAIKWYKKYRALNPDDSRVAPKIWRLQNVQYLYEDSIYFTVRKVPWNTSANEYGVSSRGKELIFVSDRAAFGGVKVLDGARQKPFYKRQVLNVSTDSLSGDLQYESVSPLQLPFDSKYHHGPISFSDDLTKAVFTQTSAQKQSDGTLPLQAYWVQKQNQQWGSPQLISTVPGHHSIRNPVLNNDGSMLIFSAQLNDSHGGRDLYLSRWTGSGWGTPRNLGSTINTKGDENYPFIHADNILYFASNGHSGLGGLDVFEVYLSGDQIGQVKNMGYPVNTQFDDFGLYLEANSTYGFITSNRNGTEAQDDVFFLEVDLQTYPLVISGLLKYRHAQWVDEDQLDLMPHAEMQLVDTYNNRVVFKTQSDAQGRFSLSIPYSSQYKIKISHVQLGKHIASLEIPKNKKEHRNHEIVVVEEHFASEAEQLEDE